MVEATYPRERARLRELKAEVAELERQIAAGDSSEETAEKLRKARKSVAWLAPFFPEEA